jgi:hypothetical protein
MCLFPFLLFVLCFFAPPQMIRCVAALVVTIELLSLLPFMHMLNVTLLCGQFGTAESHSLSQLPRYMAFRVSLSCYLKTLPPLCDVVAKSTLTILSFPLFLPSTKLGNCTLLQKAARRRPRRRETVWKSLRISLLKRKWSLVSTRTRSITLRSKSNTKCSLLIFETIFEEIDSSLWNLCGICVASVW